MPQIIFYFLFFWSHDIQLISAWYHGGIFFVKMKQKFCQCSTQVNTVGVGHFENKNHSNLPEMGTYLGNDPLLKRYPTHRPPLLGTL